MTQTRRIYRVILTHPGIEADDLARLADVPRRGLSSKVCGARQHCERGFMIEGDTMRVQGVTMTRYFIVRDYSVSLEQKELKGMVA